MMSLSKAGSSGEAPPVKKRKVDGENRSFQQRWEYEYFFELVEDKPTCLVCGTAVAVRKEYNLKRHYKTHETAFQNLSPPDRMAKIKELREARAECRLKTSAVQNRLMTRSANALHASFVVSDMLLKRGKPFSDGPLIKECMKAAASIVAPNTVSEYESISLSPNTLADRANDIAGDLAGQLRRKCAVFTHFALALDESTDITDTAQLAIFVRGIEEDMCVTEELLDLVHLRETTTGLDIFNALVSTVEKFRLEWTKFVGLATDGAPAMKGNTKSGLVKRLRLHLDGLGIPSDFPHVHCIIHQEALCAQSLSADQVMNVVVKAVNKIRAQGLNHRQFRALLEEICSGYEDVPFYTKVRWLSRAKVLKVFFELRDTIKMFLAEKKFPLPELDDMQWVSELAFLVDITGHLSALNLKLQGKGHIISDMYQAVQGFEMRLSLFEEQLRSGELFHFQALKSLPKTGLNLKKFADIVKKLKCEFENNFQDVRKFRSEINLMIMPFSMPLSQVPLELQTEAIDLRCDNLLESRFNSLKFTEFCTFLNSQRYPKITFLYRRMLAMFGSTYVCEQFFSLMKICKNRFRSRLTDEHLTAQLRVMARNNLQPDFSNLILEKQAQVSNSC